MYYIIRLINLYKICYNNILYIYYNHNLLLIADKVLKHIIFYNQHFHNNIACAIVHIVILILFGSFNKV